MSKRPKRADEMTRDELEEVRFGADLPLVDDDETLKAAGLDPATRQPLETPEARDQRLRREEEIEHLEGMSVEEHAERIAQQRNG